MIRSPWVAFAAFVVLLGGCLILPRPASAQANFDCRQPRSETVAIVCRDPIFSAQDRQIDRAYRTALEQATEPNRVRDDHAAWARRISVCGSERQCIGQSLDEELAALGYAADKGREESEAAEAGYPEPKPVYGPAPPLEREPVDPSPEEASEAVSGFLLEKPAADEVPVSIADEMRPSENRDLGGDQANDPTSPPGETTAPTSSISQMIGGGVILGLIVAVLAALLATKALADRSMSQYGWPMVLNWWNVLHLVAGAAFWGGVWMGSVVGGLVAAGGVWLIVLTVNIRRTDLLTGLAMSVVQPFVVAILFVVFQLSRNKPKPYNYISRS